MLSMTENMYVVVMLQFSIIEVDEAEALIHNTGFISSICNPITDSICVNTQCNMSVERCARTHGPQTDLRNVGTGKDETTKH